MIAPLTALPFIDLLLSSNMGNESDNVVTYGIVGVGLMGVEHIRNILCMHNAKVTCIADDFPQSIEDTLTLLRAEYPDVASTLQVFHSAELFFRARACQVAVIATPNHTHRDILMEAFDFGHPNLHILVEKPMCTNISDCRAVIERARTHNGMTFVGLEYSYMPPITRLISDTRNGFIGTPQMVAIREHRFPFLRKVRDWNRFNRNSGGTFVEKCCHFFDLFNRILYPEVPVNVFASGGQNVNHLDEMYNGERSDIMDNGFVVVNYSNNRRACLDLCMFAEASNSQEEVSIVGTKGKLEAFLPQLEVRTGIRGRDSCGDVVVERVDDERIKYRGHHHGSSYLEHLDILAEVQRADGDSGAPAKTAGFHHGLLSVAMGVAAHLSIEENRVVSLDELLSKEELKLCVEREE